MYHVLAAFTLFAVPPATVMYAIAALEIPDPRLNLNVHQRASTGMTRPLFSTAPEFGTEVLGQIFQFCFIFTYIPLCSCLSPEQMAVTMQRNYLHKAHPLAQAFPLCRDEVRQTYFCKS